VKKYTNKYLFNKYEGGNP